MLIKQRYTWRFYNISNILLQVNMKKVLEYNTLALMMALPYVLVIVDNKILHNQVSKYSLTGISHTLFLLINVFLLYKLKAKNKVLARGIYLIIGLLVAMLVRENREIIRDLFSHHIKWYLIAILFSLYYCYMAFKEGVKKPFRILQALHQFGHYNYLICGLFIVLVWSRLIGNRFVFKGVDYISYSGALKNTVEEPTQSLGYLIIMFGLGMMLKAKHTR